MTDLDLFVCFICPGLVILLNIQYVSVCDTTSSSDTLLSWNTEVKGLNCSTSLPSSVKDSKEHFHSLQIYNIARQPGNASKSLNTSVDLFALLHTFTHPITPPFPFILCSCEKLQMEEICRVDNKEAKSQRAKVVTHGQWRNPSWTW